MTPEALDSLSKQELIALILAQQEQICQLSARVAELEARLNLPPKTPSNSSLPPSKGQKANQPDKAKKLRKGRPGVARKLAENPDLATFSRMLALNAEKPPRTVISRRCTPTITSICLRSSRW